MLSSARNAACALYGLATAVFAMDLHLRDEQVPRGSGPAAHSAVAAGLPLLDPIEPMKNAAVVRAALAKVPERGQGCDSPSRSFAVLLDGKLSWVRFDARTVCQLQLLKRISTAQPGFGPRGVGEVGALVLGKRAADGTRVDVTRLVVPPFKFGGDRLMFVRADLGPLAPGESLIGTFHTHPDGDLEEGALSVTDLEFMRTGWADFHGRIGWLGGGSDRIDWLFDIVDPRDGGWNVYAHDAPRLREMLSRCDRTPDCPIDELRIVGSRYYLWTRFYDDAPEPARAER
jgi:hypothetical protein